MTNKEMIYNALGMIEGAVCVAQRNTRDVLMKAIDMIKIAIEENIESEPKSEPKCDCNHDWLPIETLQTIDCDEVVYHTRYMCTNCGAIETKNTTEEYKKLITEAY